MASFVSIEERDLANQHFDRGLSFDIRGKIDLAITEMLEAVKCDPGFAEAYNKLGDYYQKKGQMNRAIDMYLKSIELKPDVENSHFDLGSAYGHVGRYDEALTELDRALSMDPEHYEIYARRGYVKLELSLYDEAINDLKLALVKDPSDLMARFTLGRALLKKDRTVEAHQQFDKVVEHYESLIRIKDRYAEGHFYIGRCHFFTGKAEKALPFLLKAVEFDTDEIDYHFSFGLLYSDADAFSAVAEAYQATGDRAKARDFLAKALELEPQNERLLGFQARLG